jgi:hypothetical protein
MRINVPKEGQVDGKLSINMQYNQVFVGRHFLFLFVSQLDDIHLTLFLQISIWSGAQQ